MDDFKRQSGRASGYTAVLRESVLAHSLLNLEFSKYQQLKARGNSTTAERREWEFSSRTLGLLSIPGSAATAVIRISRRWEA